MGQARINRTLASCCAPSASTSASRWWTGRPWCRRGPGGHATSHRAGRTIPGCGYFGFITALDSRKTAPRGNNWGYVEQPEFDAFSDRIRAEFDPAKQDEVVAEMHTRMVDECVWLWVVHDMNPRAMSSRVKGFVQAQNWIQDLTPVSMG